jgi:diaminopimelate epimerase
MRTAAARTLVAVIAFVKGHGTENDFVLLPDPDGEVALDAGRVRRLCDRRAGIGADGVLRVVRTAADTEARGLPGADRADWFMDYRNADGSLAEMCGNGIRVFARYLRDEGLIGESVQVGTRSGVKTVAFNPDGSSTVDMGPPSFPGPSRIVVEANGHQWSALHVDMGNPHAVAFVDDLRDPGPLVDQPTWTPADAYPNGVNVEFVVRRGPGHVAMRVHERGVGETRSCGTGTCAVAVAAAKADGAPRPAAYRIGVPGGTVTVRWREDDHLELTGPAVVHARGTFDHAWLP